MELIGESHHRRRAGRDEMRMSEYWLNQGKTLDDRIVGGRTFERSDSKPGCAECCNGDRCDDLSHYDRTSCPFCLGTGEPLQGAALTPNEATE